MSADEPVLSPRERELVLSYAELGTIPRVAKHHGISVNTVRNTLYSARTKLGVRFTIEAVWMVKMMNG